MEGEGPVQPCVEVKRHQKAALLPSQFLHRGQRTWKIKKAKSCPLVSDSIIFFSLGEKLIVTDRVRLSEAFPSESPC